MVFLLALKWNLWEKPFSSVKSTLMQILKSLYVRVHMKIIPWKFRILDCKNFSCLLVKFIFFLKSRLIFNIFILYVCKQIFRKRYRYITRKFLGLKCEICKVLLFHEQNQVAAALQKNKYIVIGNVINFLRNGAPYLVAE